MWKTIVKNPLHPLYSSLRSSFIALVILHIFIMLVLAILLKSLSFVISIAFAFKHVAAWYRSAYSSSEKKVFNALCGCDLVQLEPLYL